MGTVLTEERRNLILERLSRDGKVVAADLTGELAVSPDTVRRDLRELADAGLLRRVHGGALPAAVGARPYAVRREDAQAVVGAATVEALHAVRADVLVLGVCSLHPEVGITVMDLEESYVKRAMIENAAEVVAVSSAEKLGSAAPYVVAPLDELTHLVTERSVPVDTLAQYRELGIEVVPA